MHRLLVLRNVHQPGVDYVSSYNTHPFPMDAQEGLAQGFGSQLLRTGSQELMRTGSMTSRSGVCSAAQNMRPKPIEFAIDEDSACSLIQEGVLSIWPMRGVVDVDGFVMIHLTVKANTAPIVFGDKVRIIVRESVVPTKRRKAKKRDPILERLQSARRANRENHESVVSRCTSLQREHFDQTPLPFGLMSSMPSTTVRPSLLSGTTPKQLSSLTPNTIIPFTMTLPLTHLLPYSSAELYPLLLHIPASIHLFYTSPLYRISRAKSSPRIPKKTTPTTIILPRRLCPRTN